MPGYDGKGPLKRGRLIGRGRGVCGKNTEGCREPEQEPDPAAKKKPSAR